jgi:hypothetical protein
MTLSEGRMEARDFDHPDLAVLVQPAIPQKACP